MFLAFLLISAASASPAIGAASLQALAAADSRLVMIGRRLAKGGAGLCGGAVSNPGWTIEDAEQFEPAVRDSVRAGLDLGNYPTLVAVEPGSAAARAGLRPGDELLAVNGRTVDATPSSRARRARQEALEEATAAALAQGSALVRVRRDGRMITISVDAEPGCATDFLIGRDQGLRAAASNGTQVTVSTAIIDFTRSDDELALILAHELAHNVLGHNKRHRALRVAGADRSGASGRDREREADRWALYLMARAGFDIGVAPGFWRRWGPKTSFGIFSDGSHPGWRDRAETAEAEIARIRAEREAQRPLIP